MYREYFVWIVGLVLVAAVAYGYAHQRRLQERYEGLTESQHELDALRLQVENLRTQVQKTELQVTKMESDPLEIEAAIRRDTRRVKPDEIVFNIEDGHAVIQYNTDNTQADVEHKSDTGE